jgi:hypothetical protein
MAEYINIKGQNIEVVASDPANPTLGQIWYNSTSNTLKGLDFQAAAWATGVDLGTARYSRATFGTQTDAVFAGGSPPATTAATEKYDGIKLDSIWKFKHLKKRSCRMWKYKRRD